MKLVLKYMNLNNEFNLLFIYFQCSVIKRATNIIEFGSVTDALIYIKQVLKKQPTALASKDKKHLADMAISCYVEQVFINNIHRFPESML